MQKRIFKIVCDPIEPLKSWGFLLGTIETERKRTEFYPKNLKGKGIFKRETNEFLKSYL